MKKIRELLNFMGKVFIEGARISVGLTPCCGAELEEHINGWTYCGKCKKKQYKLY